MFDTGALSAVLNGYNSQQTPAVPMMPAPAATPTGPLGNLQAIMTGGADYGSILQKIGSGMANMSQTGGDPYLSFAQGFGGSQKYTTEEQRLAAERAAAAQKQQQETALAMQRLTQDQSQFDSRMSQDQSQFDARQGQTKEQFDAQQRLSEAADKRAQMLADQSAKKSEAEIARMAKQSGISTDQMLSIERIAQAEAENEPDPEMRRQIVEKKRAELTAQVKQNLGISTGPGITAEPPKVGDVVDGYLFKGGDASNPSNWQIQ